MSNNTKQSRRVRQIGIRLTPQLDDRLRKAVARTGPYKLSVTQLVVRGIELALQELDKSRRYATPKE